MGKRLKKLTRQHKICLGALQDEFQTEREIGFTSDLLDTLVDHGLARSVLDMGDMRYRITEAGRDRLSAMIEGGVV